MYFGSSISFTESDVNTRLVKAWTAVDRLSIIWKSDLSDKSKWNFFQAVLVSIWMHRRDADKTYREKAKRELRKDITCHIEQILEATLRETTVVQPLTFHF